MAVPSAKNSGLESISNVHPGLEFASRMVRIDLSMCLACTQVFCWSKRCKTYSAVRHGTVDFSTTILEEVETSAIRRVANWR